MALGEKDVRYLAGLAHLELTDEEVGQFVPQIDAILESVRKLDELDTAGIEPTAQVTFPGTENPSLREDHARPCFSQQQALQNAPEAGNGCFKVPLVIERE